MKFRKIGVLTSGGDAPGMNASVRAIVRTAIENGVEVLGIKGGYSGLIEDKVVPLTARDVTHTIAVGGTMLLTDRCDEFKTPEGMAQAIATCKKYEIDAIVAIGGDGTFRGATDLTNHGIPTIGVTGTIDNDISATDYTVGFDTAMNTVIAMVDRLRDTAESHARCMVTEVMGRNCGEIALLTGIASGATGIAIPEIEFDVEACIAKMKTLRAEGKRNFQIIVSEGVGGIDSGFGEKLAETIEERTGIETRFNRLGHIVRGGTPTLRDRLAASRMGAKAVELLLEGKSNLVVCEIDSQMVPVDINYSFALDKMYKNKLKPGDLDSFTPSEIEEMARICERKRAYVRELYDLANALAK
ncbi:MAG: ATP-dependent 6-phosphofructokinase [Clostridia bacterium]|nr:ATP-dependent 6-phosphofructokinase [Clostridia bacterium]